MHSFPQGLSSIEQRDRLWNRDEAGSSGHLERSFLIQEGFLGQMYHPEGLGNGTWGFVWHFGPDCGRL